MSSLVQGGSPDSHRADRVVVTRAIIRTMVVDFHVHICPPRVRRERERYLQRDAGFAALYSSPKATLASAEDLINSMDRDGVAVSMVQSGGWSSHELCVEFNDYILESVARYPKRLVGFTTFQTDSIEAAVAEIERCARGGATGIGELRPESLSIGLGDTGALATLAAAIGDNGLPLLIHASEPVGHVYPGKGTMTPEKLFSFIDCFPGTTVVCAHWGGGLPFYMMMPEVRKALANVYFDSAASPFLYGPEVYRAVADLAGAERVLFGSDYPLLTQKRALDDAAAAGLTNDELALVLGSNSSRLLGLADDK